MSAFFVACRQDGAEVHLEAPSRWGRCRGEELSWEWGGGSGQLVWRCVEWDLLKRLFLAVCTFPAVCLLHSPLPCQTWPPACPQLQLMALLALEPTLPCSCRWGCEGRAPLLVLSGKQWANLMSISSPTGNPPPPVEGGLGPNSSPSLLMWWGFFQDRASAMEAPRIQEAIDVSVTDCGLFLQSWTWESGLGGLCGIAHQGQIL